MRSALGLLTIVPAGNRVPTARMLWWFPAVGAALGAAVGGAWLGAHELWALPLAAALAVAVDVIITGGLHVDGLADSADGLLPHASVERRLEIMADPAVGAFGLVAVLVALVLRTLSFGTVEPEVLAVVGLWMASRSLVAAAPSVIAAARPSGMGARFAAGSSPLIGLGIVVGGAIAVIGSGLAGAVSVAVGALAGVAVLVVANRRIGGYTGDVLGAAIVIAETAGLVTLAARW